MAITLNINDRIAMSALVSRLKTVPRFLQTFIFKKMIPKVSNLIEVDILVGGQKLAPLTIRGSKGKDIGLGGHDSRLVKTTNIRLTKNLKPS